MRAIGSVCMKRRLLCCRGIHQRIVLLAERPHPKPVCTLKPVVSTRPLSSSWDKDLKDLNSEIEELMGEMSADDPLDRGDREEGSQRQVRSDQDLRMKGWGDEHTEYNNSGNSIPSIHVDEGMFKKAEAGIPLLQGHNILVCHSGSLAEKNKINITSELQKLYPGEPSFTITYQLFKGNGSALISIIHEQKISAVVLAGGGVLEPDRVPLFQLLGRAYPVVAILEGSEDQSERIAKFKSDMASISPGLVKFVEGFEMDHGVCIAVSSVLLLCRANLSKGIAAADDHE